MKNIIIATVIGLSFVAGYFLGRPSLSDYSKLSKNFDICQKRESLMEDVIFFQEGIIGYPEDEATQQYKDKVKSAMKKLRKDINLDYLN